MSGNGYQFSSMLSTANVASIFGVSPGTVRRWAEKGKLKAYRFGRRMLFTPADVAAAYMKRDIDSSFLTD